MRSSDEAGLTLIEMLIVLAIIGVMASATVIGIGSASRGASAESEAQRLAERVRLAQDEAMITARPIALAWDEKGYDFLAWDETARRWRTGAIKAFGDRHDLPSGMRFTGDAAAVTVLRTGPFDLGLEGGGAPWRVRSDGLNVTVAASR